jgi:hypothetical protein
MEPEPRPATWRWWRYALSVAVLGTVLIGAGYAIDSLLTPSSGQGPLMGGPVGTHLQNPGTTLHMVFNGPTPATPVRLYFSGADGTLGQFWSEGGVTSDLEGDLIEGTFHVVIPAKAPCSTCDPEVVPPGPLRCEGTVEIGPAGSYNMMTVTFAADGSCAIVSPS